jgi:4-hydroxybenzoate polyprenyltransferase
MLLNVLKFVMANSIFLAFNGALCVVFADYLYGSPISLVILAAAFLITFSIYFLNNFTDKPEDAVNKNEFGSKKMLYYVAPSVIAMFLSLAIGITTSVLTLIVLIIPLIFGVVYSVPIKKSIPRLKEVLGVKSVVVALCWATTGAFLPLSSVAVTTDEVILVFCYIFVVILVNTVIFDTLDVKGDVACGVNTLPAALGFKKTTVLLLIMNSFLVGWLLFCFLDGFFVSYIPTLVFGVVYEYLIIWYFLKGGRRKLHAQLTVDGVWLPIVVFMRVFVR